MLEVRAGAEVSDDALDALLAQAKRWSLAHSSTPVGSVLVKLASTVTDLRAERDALREKVEINDQHENRRVEALLSIQQELAEATGAKDGDLLRELRERHVELTVDWRPLGRDSRRPVCGACRTWWPCDAIRAADEIKRLEVERRHFLRESAHRQELLQDACKSLTLAKQRALEAEQRVAELTAERNDLLGDADASQHWQTRALRAEHWAESAESALRDLIADAENAYDQAKRDGWTSSLLSRLQRLNSARNVVERSADLASLREGPRDKKQEGSSNG